ncbi:hypothetical protein D1007_29491 [Hordeum vulgare]|nr:hypothetical protein D1007_29491 [Hordeum vulgare]
MASRSTSAAGSGPLGSRRGLISCLHSRNCRAGDATLLSDEDLPQAIGKLILSLYEEAVSRLPCDAMPDLLDLLANGGGGSCLGLLDPVSNIILNTLALLPKPKDAAPAAAASSTASTSTSTSTSPPDTIYIRGTAASQAMDMAEYNDVLDPRCLLRLQVHSLKGLMKLAAFVDPRFSTPACTLGFLCSTKCDIANMLPSSTTESCEMNPFHESAKAAGHNRPLGLGELHRRLLSMPDTRSELLSFITEAQANGIVLRVDDMTACISLMWNKNRSGPSPQTVQAPQLCAGALMAVSSERSQYEDMSNLFRSKIEELLEEYTTTQQFLGSEYKLDTILGVEERNKGYHPVGVMLYQANFTATCDLGLERTLFFAQFSLSSRKPAPEFCCPLPYANAGRCYYGERSARKIVYPDDAKYIPDDITVRGTRCADGMLGMDLVYFSPELDVEIAESLNVLHSEEEEEKRKKRKRRGACRN